MDAWLSASADVWIVYGVSLFEFVRDSAVALRHTMNEWREKKRKSGHHKQCTIFPIVDAARHGKWPVQTPRHSDILYNAVLDGRMRAHMWGNKNSECRHSHAHFPSAATEMMRKMSPRPVHFSHLTINSVRNAIEMDCNGIKVCDFSTMMMVVMILTTLCLYSVLCAHCSHLMHIAHKHI